MERHARVPVKGSGGSKNEGVGEHARVEIPPNEPAEASRL